MQAPPAPGRATQQDTEPFPEGPFTSVSAAGDQWCNVDVVTELIKELREYEDETRENEMQEVLNVILLSLFKAAVPEASGGVQPLPRPPRPPLPRTPEPRGGINQHALQVVDACSPSIPGDDSWVVRVLGCREVAESGQISRASREAALARRYVKTRPQTTQGRPCSGQRRPGRAPQAGRASTMPYGYVLGLTNDPWLPYWVPVPYRYGVPRGTSMCQSLGNRHGVINLEGQV